MVASGGRLVCRCCLSFFFLSCGHSLLKRSTVIITCSSKFLENVITKRQKLKLFGPNPT